MRTSPGSGTIKVVRPDAAESNGVAFEITNPTDLYVDDDNATGIENGTVASPFNTIGEGMVAATTGDTVHVADGTYNAAGEVVAGDQNRDMDFGGKGIVVQGNPATPSACIIDCGGSGRGFSITSGEDEECLIQSLTITGGNTPGSGGGIYISGSSPTIRNCVIDLNTAVHAGGIYCYGADPDIIRCTISNNTSSGDAGGISCQNSSYPRITECNIFNNQAGNYGGGLCCGDSSPTLAHCVIKDNSASSGGGGVYCGGGTSSPTFINCLIANNEATGSGSGGGIYCYNNSGSLLLTNCSLVNNACGWNGGGIYNYHASGTSYIMLENSIIWGNSAANNYHQIGSFTGSQVDMYSCCYSNAAGDNGGVGVITADGNCTTADPLFAVPGSPGPAGGGDFHLTAGSPCIDTGENNYVTWSKDLDGTARIKDGGGGSIVDMGVYEF